MKTDLPAKQHSQGDKPALQGQSAASADTSVHTIETSVDQLSQLSYRDYLLRFDRDEYTAAVQTYSIIDVEEDRTSSHRLEQCRTFAWFAVNDNTNNVAVLSSACHLRWCPMCSGARSAAITRSVTAWLSRAKSPKMLTLTLKHSDAPLHHQIKYLYACFRQYRMRKLLAESIRGGIWFFQVKYYPESDQWHPHLHCLIDAEYMPQKLLSDEWLKTTKHSSIVDIRQVRRMAEAAKYVARYAARPAQLSKLPYERRHEVMTDLHARRICGSWGSARTVSLAPQNASTTGPWHTVGSWSAITEQSKTCKHSLALLKAWRSKTPVSKTVLDALWLMDHPQTPTPEAANSPTDPQYTFADLHPPPSA